MEEYALGYIIAVDCQSGLKTLVIYQWVAVE